MKKKSKMIFRDACTGCTHSALVLRQQWQHQKSPPSFQGYLSALPTVVFNPACTTYILTLHCLPLWQLLIAAGPHFMQQACPAGKSKGSEAVIWSVGNIAD